MAFLRNKDYEYIISEADLDVITGSEYSYVRDAELAAQSEIESYLRQRYDTNLIFKDILSYSDATTFFINDLVEWIEPTWLIGTTYAEDDRVSLSGVIYISLQNANVGNAVTDTDYWTAIGVNEGLYYARQETLAVTPNNSFSYDVNSYSRNHDLITGWNRASVILYLKKFSDNTIRFYTSESNRTNDVSNIGYCVYPELGINQSVILDILQGSSKILGGQLEIQGFIPDDTEWSVTATNNWTSGDNRNQQIRLYMIDIVLYHLHSRINPRNIPDFRIARRDDAVKWLGLISNGKIMANLPIHQNETKGQNISYNSAPKFSNGDY